MEHQTLPSSQELNTIWRGLDPNLPDFRFEWSAKRTRSAGTIWYKERLIRLSVKHYLEFGMDMVIDTLKHEAAHYLGYLKSGKAGHNQWFWYYLGMFGATRHCPTLSSNMKEQRLRVVGQRNTHGIQYDPLTKTFRQV